MKEYKDENNKMLIVQEYANKGDLKSYLDVYRKVVSKSDNKDDKITNKSEVHLEQKEQLLFKWQRKMETNCD